MKTLRFCANLNFMFQDSECLLERYSLAKNAGFKAVECANPYIFPVEKVVEAKNKAGVQQVLINCVVDDSMGYAAVPSKEREFAEGLDLTVKYAKALDCKLIHIMSGIVKDPSEENDITFENNLKTAVSVLEKEKIIGVIEPINCYSLPNYYLNNYEKAVDVITKLSSPFLKLQLDIFHLQQIKGNITRNIKCFLPHVGHVQIAQVPDRHEPNSSGEICFKYLFDYLEVNSYDGWIGLEYKPKGSTVEGLGWIKEYGYTL